MGFFNDAADQAVPGGNLTKPLIIAAGALLLNHFLHGRSQDDKAAPAPAPAPQGSSVPDGGLIGGLGGLIEKLTQAGQGSTVNSWINHGPNQPIQPGQLGSAIGKGPLSDIAARAGVSEQDLLSQLAQALPGLIDKLTPNGRLPTQAEVSRGYGR